MYKIHQKIETLIYKIVMENKKSAQLTFIELNFWVAVFEVGSSSPVDTDDAADDDFNELRRRPHLTFELTFLSRSCKEQLLERMPTLRTGTLEKRRRLWTWCWGSRPRTGRCTLQKHCSR